MSGYQVMPRLSEEDQSPVPPTASEMQAHIVALEAKNADLEDQLHAMKLEYFALGRKGKTA